MAKFDDVAVLVTRLFFLLCNALCNLLAFVVVDLWN